jgi:hypothetical protein
MQRDTPEAVVMDKQDVPASDNTLGWIISVLAEDAL